VEIDRSGPGLVLKNWGMAEVPAQLIDKHPLIEDAKAEALKKLLQANKIEAREAVVVVGNGDTFVKIFTLAALPRAEAAQALRWKLAEEVPYPIEDALFDFYPAPRGKSGSANIDYVTACIHRKNYLEALYILRRAGLKLAGITVLPEALRELFQKELIGPEDTISSIIYMGRRTTNISIFRHGVFDFNRELPIGGEHITRAMAGIMVTPKGRVEVALEEAERIKMEHGVPIDLEKFPQLGEIPLSQLQANVRPALEKMQNEIARTFEYYKGQTGEGNISKIILTGGSSLTPNLKEFIAQGLGIPVITPEPLPKLNPRLSAALGAAVAGPGQINLIPEEIKFKWQIVANKLLRPQYLAAGYAALLALVYFIFWLQIFFLQTEADRNQQKLNEYKPRLARLEAFDQLAKDREKWRQTVQSFEQQRNKAPYILSGISRLIPPNAALNTLSIGSSEVKLQGIIFKYDEPAETLLSRFVLKLSASPFLSNVKMVQAVKNSDYSVESLKFEISARIKE
jgi:type IV pilus assembly protein PilM